MRRWIIIIYFVVLSIGVGLILTLGALVAPVVFNSNSLITENITQFSQGLIMTEIFMRGNYILTFVLIYIVIYEGYDYKRGKRDIILNIATFIAIFTLSLFVFYYSPQIIELQNAHDTNSTLFDTIHKGSELDYKITLVALMTLLLRRFSLLIVKK